MFACVLVISHKAHTIYSTKNCLWTTLKMWKSLFQSVCSVIESNWTENGTD